LYDALQFVETLDKFGEGRRLYSRVYSPSPEMEGPHSSETLFSISQTTGHNPEGHNLDDL